MTEKKFIFVAFLKYLLSTQKKYIDLENIPRHIAVIMDGNGRWAQNQGVKRLFGHQNAIEAVRNVTEGSAELGVDFLTLFTFSTENWDRPELEVKGLMSLLVNTIKGELETLQKNNIKLTAIGATDELPSKAKKMLQEAIHSTSQNTGMTLILALNYSGKWDLMQAIKKLVHETKTGLDIKSLESRLSTYGIPNPELLIRTSGEMRISNFMLWQIAYTELFFTDILWPDFRIAHLHEAIISYQKRERRFGKTSDQVSI